MKTLLKIVTCTGILAAVVLTGCQSAPASPPSLPTQAHTATSAATTLPPPTAQPPTPTAPIPGYPWWNESIFYEIFVRSFYDSNGDGNGDFNGILAKLDYLNDGDPGRAGDLGVSGLWLMPIFPSTSYHGYDVTDYMAVNPDFGSLDDFKRLLEAAHQRGIRVIIDWPLNHTSVEHPWFQQAINPGDPYRDWYIWSSTDRAAIGPWGQVVWHDGPNGGYYYGTFWSGMPDLNFANPEVVSTMQEVMRFWMDEVGVDGFRLDGARYIIEEGSKLADTGSTQAYLHTLTQACKTINPECLMLGEVWTSDIVVNAYIRDGDLDMAFDFDLAGGMMESARMGNTAGVNRALKTTLRLFPSNQFAPFLTNHDMNRVMSQLGGEVDKAKTAASLLLTGPGVPFIYYGEEIGMTGKKPDEMLRTPMQWSAETQAGFTTGTPWIEVNADYPQVNVLAESQQPGTLLDHYQKLIDLRNSHPALLYGDTYRVESDSNAVYALLRQSAGETILVLINLSDQDVSDYTLTLDKGPLSGTYQAGILLGKGNPPLLTANAKGGFEAYRAGLLQPPYSTLVIQLTP